MNISEAKKQIKRLNNIKLVAKKLGYYVDDYCVYCVGEFEFVITPLKYKLKVDHFLNLDEKDGWSKSRPVVLIKDLEELESVIYGIAFAQGYRIQDWDNRKVEKFITSEKEIKEND